MSPVVAISTGTLAAIVVIFVIDLFAVMFGLSFVRARKASARRASPPRGAANSSRDMATSAGPCSRSSSSPPSSAAPLSPSCGRT
jgi:hypothetical protein